MNDDGGGSGDRTCLEGRYANFFQIGHNAFEFVLDFGQAGPTGSVPRYHTRIIAGPVYAKVLFAIMRKSIERYEEAFGKIPEDGEQE